MSRGPFGLPEWLAPVVPAGLERQSLSRAMRVIFLAVILAALATSGRFETSLGRAVLWLVIGALCAALVIDHRGAPEWAATIGLVALLSCTALLAWTARDGFRTIYFLLLACLLMVAAVLLRSIPYSVFSALVLAIIAAVGVKEMRFVAHGGQVTRSPTTYTLILDVECIFCLGALTGGLLASNVHRSLRKVRESTRELAAANAALQASVEAQERHLSALRLSEERYRMLAHALQSAGECISITDTGNRILFVNDEFLRTYGYGEHELIGQHIGILRSARTPPEVYAEILPATMAGGWSGELWNRTRDGRHFTISLATSVVCDENGRGIALVGIARDITERKRAEEALRASEERFRSLSNLALEGIMTHENGVILDANLAFARLFGYEQPEELIGRNGPELLLTPESLARIRQRMERKETGLIEVTGLRKDGSTFEAETDSRLVKYLGHDATMVSFHDVTERRRAVEEKAKLQAQLHHAQKMESIGRLAGGVAHDFNNLLIVINGYSRMLLGDLSPGDPLRDPLEEIYRAGERAEGLTQQLLAFSRKQLMKPRVLDLNRVVGELQPMLARLLGEDVEVCVRLHSEAATICADSHQLLQVVMNLAVNSRDAMPHGGKVLIETAIVLWDQADAQSHPGARPGSYVMLTVSDNGAGMDEETRWHIFEPFFTTKEVGKGTGLGLSMILGIVEQSGGHIEVQSEPDHGTTFKIFLPRVGDAAMDSEQPEAAPVMGGKETVLVVEDQPEVRKYVAAVLGAYGYHVMATESANEALVLCEREGGRIDLVLTDVVMPNVGGRELANRLGKRWPEIKVLFMSGYTDDAIVLHGVSEKAAELIQKPFSPDQLALKVREILEKRLP
ncbi:MAG: PAS domain S-box protein [Bryobacteraceae bacterium]